MRITMDDGHNGKQLLTDVLSFSGLQIDGDGAEHITLTKLPGINPTGMRVGLLMAGGMYKVVRKENALVGQAYESEIERLRKALEDVKSVRDMSHTYGASGKVVAMHRIASYALNEECSAYGKMKKKLKDHMLGIPTEQKEENEEKKKQEVDSVEIHEKLEALMALSEVTIKCRDEETRKSCGQKRFYVDQQVLVYGSLAGTGIPVSGNGDTVEEAIMDHWDQLTNIANDLCIGVTEMIKDTNTPMVFYVRWNGFMWKKVSK